MYWNTNETSGNPTSALNKSSWLFLSSTFVKWFHLYLGRVSQSQSMLADGSDYLRAGISIQEGRSFNHLSPIFTSLALERVVRVAYRFVIKRE